MDAVLAAHFKQQAELQIEPWRIELHKQERLIEDYRALGNVALQSLIVDKAKMGDLSPDEVMSLTYLVYGDSEGEATKFYVRILLMKQGQERVTSHNWYVAKHAGPSFLSQYGDRIGKLTWPLFPQTEGNQVFSLLNYQILATAAPNPSGGAASASPSRKPLPFRIDPAGAGYAAPVVPDAHGNPVVELTEVQNSFLAMKKKLEALERQVQQQQRSFQQAEPAPRRQEPKHEQPAQGWRGKKAARNPRGGDAEEESKKTDF